MNKQRSKEQVPEACDCRACRALRDECGEQNYPFLSKHLLIHGWAGQMTQAERAYRRTHSKAARASAIRGAANAEALRAARNLDGRTGQGAQMAMEMDRAV